MFPMDENVLDRIVEKTRAELEPRKRKIPADLFELEGETRSLEKAVASANEEGRRAVITEIKPASPSQGSIRRLDAAAAARGMERGGAAAISVLTEPFYFQGSPENLQRAKEATGLPVMRKDFIVDEYQLMEAKHYGADAVLLMVSVLGEEIGGFCDKALELGMEALVEVHGEEELDTASSCGAGLIGINNRNLSDLSVDLETTGKLAPKVTGGKLTVSESGIKTRKDLDFVLKYADAALVGTSLMRSDNVEEAVRRLVK